MGGLFGQFDIDLLIASFSDLETSIFSIFILFLIIKVLMCPREHP